MPRSRWSYGLGAALGDDGGIVPSPEATFEARPLGPQDAVRVYRGIPYAASTAGANRWRPPQDVVAWEGIRDCTKFGPACPQRAYAKDSPYYRDAEPQSEDCLSLNIWSAAKDAKEPARNGLDSRRRPAPRQRRGRSL